MHVILSYTCCKAYPWNPKFDYVGKYTLKERKSAEELNAEKAYCKSLKRKKPSPYKLTEQSVYTVKDNTCYFLIGSWQELKRELDRLREPYTVEEAFDKDLLPEPDLSVLSSFELREGQAETLALLTTAHCGMICSTVSFGKSFIIKLLCMMYPTLNILIVCSMSQVIKQLYQDINKDLPGQVGLLDMDHSDVHGKRIICSTPQSCIKLNKEQVHLVLVDECSSVALGTAFGNNILNFCFARRFGFTATPIRNQGDYKALEALLGPVLQDFTFQEAQAAGNVTPIKFCMVPVTKKIEYLADQVLIQKNGQDIWVPETAVTVEQILDRKKKELPDYIKQKCFYVSNYNRNDIIADTFYRIKEAAPDIQILLMTQSLEHLIRLHQRMKFCAIAHGERGSLSKFNNKKGLYNVDMNQYKQTSDELDRVKAAFSKGTLKYCIATGVFSAGLNLSHLAVLIRCDAAVSGIPCIQIPGRLARLDDNKPTAYLIDFSDEFCREAAGRALSRTKKYKTQGWTESTLEDIIAALQENQDVCKHLTTTAQNTENDVEHGQ